MSPPSSPLILVLGHPGHELRVFGHLERFAPLVLVLSDGSGRTGRSRLDRTTEILGETGARPGPVYGWMSDQEIYADLRAGRHEKLLDVVRTLASLLVREGAAVAGDAAEGFNPTHDVCRLIVNAAVSIASASGRDIANLDFPLDAAPDEGAGETCDWTLVLDDGCLERKAAAAARYTELAVDVRSTLQRFGLEAFRTEVLRPVRYGLDLRGRTGDPPFYETHGARRVEEGAYDEVLRFASHVMPFVRALEEEVRACASS